MKRFPIRSIQVFLFFILLSACTLSPAPTNVVIQQDNPLALPDTPGPTYTPPEEFTATPQPVFTPTETATPAATATEAPNPTSDFPGSNFYVLTQGGRVGFFDSSTGQVCAMDTDWAAKVCSPGDQPVSPTALAWSPSGDRLLIDDGGDVLRIWTLGGGIRFFRGASAGATILAPAWSPDGQSIAYASDEFHRTAGDIRLYDIFIAALDGSAPRYMTTAKAANNHMPRWSPDGQWLAYISAPILKYPDGTTRPSTYQVTVLSVANPSKPIYLTTDESYELTPESALAWSPLHDRIAFYGRRLFFAYTDGSGVHQLGGTDYGKVTNITWLPDGTGLLIGDRLVNGTNGDPTKLTFSFDTNLAAWVLPATQNALAPLPKPNCAAAWTKLFAGATAMVAGGPNDLPIVVRNGPSKANKFLTNIYPQTIVKVVEGPICADGLVYWEVENAQIPGGSGWTAEGDGSEYWLERLGE